MLSQTYMQIAYLIAKNSKCVSWKVGALIEKTGESFLLDLTALQQGK